MTLEEIKKAYRACLRWRWSKTVGKKLSKTQLDKMLYVVEKYIRCMEEE